MKSTSARSRTEACRRAACGAGFAALCALLLGGAPPAPQQPAPGQPTPTQPAPEQAVPKPATPKQTAPKQTAPKPTAPKQAAPKPAAAPAPQGGGPQAATPSAELLAAVQARYEGVQDMRASFEQRSRVASLGREDVSSGKLAVRRPGRMRWEYTAPEAHVLTLDGATLRMYVPSEHQLQIASLDPSTFSPTALNFLLGAGDLRQDFTAEPLPQSERGELGLRLRPKQDSGFEYLELWLEPGALTLRESVVLDLFGNRTAVRFADLVENAGVPETIVAIDVPAETEVIDLR